MGKGNASFRTALRIARTITELPASGDTAYQCLESMQKTRRLMELAFKEYTGFEFTERWWEENKKYL